MQRPPKDEELESYAICFNKPPVVKCFSCDEEIATLHTFCVPCSERTKWVSVQDGLPEVGHHVLVYDLGCAEYDETGIQSGKYTGDKSDPWKVTHFCENAYYHKVSHWMPLPSPPIDKE